MNSIMKIFTYLYRPLPFDAKNFFQLIVSFENIILIYLSIIGFIGIFFKSTNRHLNQSRLMIFIFVLLGSIILSFTSANLGINSRQKWMIFPAILILAYQFSPNSIYIIYKKKFMK